MLQEKQIRSEKRFKFEAEERGRVAKTLWNDVETTTNGTSKIKELFDSVSVFANPEMVSVINFFIETKELRPRIW